MIEELKAQISKLEASAGVFLKEMGDLEARSKMLEEYDHRVRGRESELTDKLKELDAVALRQKEEQKFLDKTRAEQTIKDTYIKEEIKILAEKQIDVDRKKEQLDSQEKRVQELVLELAGLKAKEVELNDLQTVINREKAISAERGKMLDTREKKLEAEQTRLQRISTSLG